MEFLGYTENAFTRTKKNWKPINLVYENEEKFCEATSKLISNFKDECRFIIADSNDERHFVDVLDYRYDSLQNTIKVFPENVRVVKK
jgi:hypothetical protein